MFGFGPKKICTSCGHMGAPSVRSRGSYVVLFFLLLCFIVPGLFYILYMATGRIEACPRCRLEGSMIPLDTPRGQALSREMGYR